MGGQALVRGCLRAGRSASLSLLDELRRACMRSVTLIIKATVAPVLCPDTAPDAGKADTQSCAHLDPHAPVPRHSVQRTLGGDLAHAPSAPSAQVMLTSPLATRCYRCYRRMGQERRGGGGPP